MPQPPFRRPLHEPYLRHQFRPHPLHLPHLVSRHAAAPAGGLRVRQIDEGAVIDMVRLQRLEDLAAQMGNEASPHLAGEPQTAVIVVRRASMPSSGRSDPEAVLRDCATGNATAPRVKDAPTSDIGSRRYGVGCFGEAR